jgi:hypothetical protein
MSLLRPYLPLSLSVVMVGFELASIALASAAGAASTLPVASTPVISLASGTYTTAKTVTILDRTAKAAIYYTVNDQVPTDRSAKYTGPITIKATETLKAIAIASGYSNSAVTSATYTIHLPAAKPTFSVAPGTYFTVKSVTIHDTTPGAKIYYTLDDKTPTVSSTRYTGAIDVAASETLKAIAVASGYSESAVATAAYTIELPTDTPTFSPKTGTYTSAQTITISDKTPNATIHYTIGAAMPTASSTKYAGALKLSASETIHAIAVAPGHSKSAVATAAYTIDLNPLGPLAISLGINTIVVSQDGTPVVVPVKITVPAASPAPVVELRYIPAGITAQFVATDGGPSGTLTFTGSPSAPPGSYSPTVIVSQSNKTASQSFSLVSALGVGVGNTTDTTLGVNGELKQFMSTSFQIAEWTEGFFSSGATETAIEDTLDNLGPQHIRMQAVSQGVPMQGNTGTASDWDFTLLDSQVQPILTTADHSPEFQVAVAPAWMDNSSGQLDVANHLNDFAAYAANLVRYYNKGGFDWGGTHFQSPSGLPVTWWGIFNEPDYNGITNTQYVQIYNAVVPAMLAVDPAIKFSALEFSGSALGTGWSSDPEQYLPPFFAPANAGGVNAQVNIVSNHFYSTCDQTTTDDEIFATIPQFAAVENYIYQEIDSRSDLAGVPVWTTENNVNADYEGANGMSTCNPGQLFVVDQRGTSAFFAAWRPYIFSQLGKAGNQGLFQWAFAGDQQYGEVDNNGNPYLSYWVDKTLASVFPSTPASPGPSILALNATDTTSIESLATRNSNGSVVVMVVDRAVASPGDDNGTGVPRTVVVDVSSLGSFQSASLLTLDATTNTSTGPVAASIAPASRMTLSLPGYGVAFLTLTP